MAFDVHRRMLETLRKVDRPGTFCTSGCLPATLPGLRVAGVGTIGLPLDKRQAEALKKQAKQAPYGKGTETLVDTDVRRVWEIDAEQVATENPAWQDLVQQAVGAAQAELGLANQSLKAHLYKLLLYERGSFFQSHRDGEKLDRMVATLVIVLPSDHRGGEIVVRHEGRETTVDFGPASRFQTQFAAFYADCEHEIRPVSSGFRAALVYNLTLDKSHATVTAPTTPAHIAEAAKLLREWSGRRPSAPAEGGPKLTPKSAVLLDHRYTQAGLSRAALKGLDRAKADILFAAAREAGCDAFLALVTYWESGSAQPSSGFNPVSRRRRSFERFEAEEEEYEEYEDDEYEDDADFGSGAAGEHVMEEVYGSNITAAHLTDSDGNALDCGALPLNIDEIVSQQPLNTGRPDLEEYEGYTGNEGLTLERWYHRAAVVLWPADRRFDILCEAGVEAAVRGLGQMVAHRRQAGPKQRALLKQPCLEFAARIIAHWPERKFASGRPEACIERDFNDAEYRERMKPPGERGAITAPLPHLLSLLELLDEVALIATWIRGVLARDASLDPGAKLGDVCEKFGWATFQDELLQLFRQTTLETLERHAELLADWSLRKVKDSDRRTLCGQLAQELMSFVERWDSRRTNFDWRARVIDLSQLLPSLVQTFLALDEPELLDRLADYVRQRPKEFDLTTVQVPALVSLATWLKKNVRQPCPALQRWLQTLLAELEFRASRPPQKPTDGRRDATTGCSCADCRVLSDFLEDPDRQVLRLPLPESRRRHLHSVIDGRRLDTTHVTERRGRPYTLVCTKTQESYERVLAAHQVDLAQIEEIRDLFAWHEKLKTAPTRPRSAVKKPKKRS